MLQPATAQNVVVAVVHSLAQAEGCIARLRHAGCTEGILSIVALDDSALKNPAGDALWTVIQERLSGRTVLTLPRIGTVTVAGPLGGWMVAAVENEAVFGGFSALGAALYGLGIAKGDALRYEAAVQAGGILIIAHGASCELSEAREILAAPALTSD